MGKKRTLDDHPLVVRSFHPILVTSKKLCIAVLLSLFSFGGWAQSVHIKDAKTTYKRLFKEVEKQTGIITIFSNNEVDMNQAIQLNPGEYEVRVLYQEMLKKQPFTFRLEGKYVVIKPGATQPVTGKKEIPVVMRKVMGVVTDDTGLTVPGVNVILKEQGKGTVTNLDGEFMIYVPNLQGTLEFSFIGFERKAVPVDGNTTINVQLKTEVNTMDDVVVTGYFSKKKDSYTGSVRSFSGTELRSVSTQNVLSTLAVLDPGFTLVENIDAGSDPNQVPEFQIQGQSSLEGEFGTSPNMPTFILDGFEVTAEQVFDLDPNRVKSLTILKDAAATAIYGSRAANGVVVVETVAPEMGKLKLTYTGAADFNIADLSYYNIMDAAEKLEYERLAGLYSSENIYYQDNLLDQYNERLALVAQGVNTDWMAIPLKDVGVSQKHSIYVEGGDESFRYGVDFNMRDVQGVMKGSSNTRYGTGIKLNYRLKDVSIQNHMAYSNVNRQNSPFGSFAQYTYFNPYYYPYNENGTIKKVLHDFESSQVADVYNPLYNTTLATKDQESYSNFTDNFSLNWNVLKGLQLKANLSINQVKRQNDVFKPADHTSFVNADLKGSYYKSVTEVLTIDGNAVASYYYSLKKHLFNMAVVGNIKESKTDGFNITAYNFPNDNIDHIGMGIEFADGDRPNGFNFVNRLVGWVNNFNYSYDNRYLVDFSIRSDASSIYGADKRWGTFGSLGMGWNIHNESFLKGSEIINELKLRGSLGTTGSNNFNPYQAMMMYSYSDPYINGLSYDGNIGALLMAYGNTNLRWQKTRKQNIGVDFSLLKSRITGLFNVYNNLSEGVLIDVVLAPSTGFDSFKDNLGSVDNSGFDFSVRGVVVKNANLQWDLFLNVTHNKNVLLEINDALAAFNDEQDQSTTENSNQKPVVRYRENQSINTIWANESLGIDPNTGEEVFLDLNGEKTNVWSTANYKPMGNADPDFFGNFGTMVRYKGWQLDTYFMYSYGGDIYNSTLVDKIENVSPLNNADKRVLYDRWKTPGDVSQFKAIDNTELTMPTSRFIEEQNYIWLKTLNLSYTFDKLALQKIKAERLKLSLITNDLFRWSTVQVERGISYPFARTYSLSAQITF